MKEKYLKFCLDKIKTSNPKITEVKLDELRYGLEGLYITLTKTVVIFTIAFLLGIFKEMFLLLLFFNILRVTGFGLHATKSWICMISSIVIFIFLPFLSKILIIPFNIKLILGIISIILIYLYAPSDTNKRPIINKKRRKFYKIYTTINCILLVSISLYIKNDVISNLIIFGIYNEIILIIPITYKIFHLSYNNYLNYQNV